MEGASSKPVLVMEPPKGYDIFGDPKVGLRVGDGYQANIPSLVLLSDDNQQINSQNDVKITAGMDNDRLMGLPIPLVWTNQNFEKRTAQLGYHCCDSSDGHRLVPGLEDKQWSEIEEAGFLLGLYIFGKNFVQVKKLVGCEKMGDIMSFYYGKFYKSRQYRRWAECRQKKSKKRVYGHKIFTGPRQQEFVSRLLASVTEELQGALLEESKTYAMGNVSIDEYVFNLKALVGIDRLVKAVGIGKGKKDLTGPSVDISKCNQTLYACLDVPAGKAWSSLTTTAVIEFLTQNCRLSKAKSIDLFWEAVWPRLLAQGWHSEQPKGYSYITRSKQSLVFLVPGVKKFSRRKLVKGEDYFDSISDVLNKIAKEPTLLELEASTEQSGAAKLDDVVDHRDLVDGHTAYLKPRDTNPDIEFVGLTIIDTSLATSVTGKVRKATHWPVEFFSTPQSGSQFEEEIENNILEEPREESDSGDASCFEQNATNLNASMVDHTISRSSANGHVSASSSKQITFDVAKSAATANQLQKKKSRLVRSINQNGFVDTPSAVKKLKEPTDCSPQEMSQNSTTSLMYDVSSQRENKESSFHNVNATGNGISRMGLSQLKLASENCAANHSSKSYSGTNRVSLNNELPHENPRLRMVIDLNLPYNADNDLDGAPSIKMKENNGAVKIEPETMINSVRHSTRNRPLTAKVLDAIADGFFEVSPKRKRGQSPSANCNGRPSQQARATSNGIMTTGFGAQTSDLEGYAAETSNSTHGR